MIRRLVHVLILAGKCLASSRLWMVGWSSTHMATCPLFRLETSALLAAYQTNHHLKLSARVLTNYWKKPHTRDFRHCLGISIRTLNMGKARWVARTLLRAPLILTDIPHLVSPAFNVCYRPSTTLLKTTWGCTSARCHSSFSESVRFACGC